MHDLQTFSKAQSDRPAIVFDFGGVLIDWHPRYLYRKLFNNDDLAVDNFLAEIGFYEWNVLQDAGRPFSEAISELCARHPHHCDLIRAYDERFEESISGPIGGTVEILRKLHSRQYRLYGLSNWSAVKFQLVRGKYEFFNWFDEIVVSGEVRINKPDPGIFQVLLDRISLPAEECIFIDDSAANIAAAASLGFRTIHYKNAQLLQEQLCTLGIM